MPASVDTPPGPVGDAPALRATRRWAPAVGGAVFAAGSGAALWHAGAPSTGWVLAVAGGAVCYTEHSEGRIPHPISLTAAAAIAAAAVFYGSGAVAAAAVAWTVVVAAFWVAGVGPLGGDGALTRRRRTRGKSPLAGGGDPAWCGAVAAAAASSGAACGCAPLSGSGLKALLAAGETANVALAAGSLLALVGALSGVGAVTVAGGRRGVKAGPYAAVGGVLAIAAASMWH